MTHHTLIVTLKMIYRKKKGNNNEKKKTRNKKIQKFRTSFLVDDCVYVYVLYKGVERDVNFYKKKHDYIENVIYVLYGLLYKTCELALG
jgi:hypothetical protein